MRLDSNERTSADRRNVQDDEEINDVADFVAFIVSGEKVPGAKWPKAQAGSTSFFCILESSLNWNTYGLPDGNLSDWMCEDPDRWGMERLRQSLKYLRAIANPRNTQLIRKTGLEMEQELDQFIPNFQNGDYSPLNRLFRKIGPELGIDGNLDLVPDPKVFRVMQAEMKCLILHRASLQNLIRKAGHGDKDAALKLIKVDSLFLHDSCTVGIIREAEKQNDREFLQAMAIAVEYQFKFGKKDLVRLGIYLLTGLDVDIPRFHLRNLLDPEWNKFNDDGFEKFVTRSRREIRENWNQ